MRKIKVKAKPKMVKFYKNHPTEMTLSSIIKILKNKNVSVGDKVVFPLLNKNEITMTVADILGDDVVLVSEDIFFFGGMNFTNTNRGGWRDCEMRKTLFDEVLSQFPDELNAAIKPRTIIQQMDGEEFTSEDKLWIPSFTEIFGHNGYKASLMKELDFKDRQFEYYKSRKNRIKSNIDGQLAPWWLRSVYYSDYFYSVDSLGYYNYYYPYSAIGVVFGFVI